MLLFIHRKDLRTEDLPAFTAMSLRKEASVHVLFLDPNLLSDGRAQEPSGRAFLQRVQALAGQYDFLGKTLHVLYGEPAQLLEAILHQHPIREIFWHADVTPYAKQRDAQMREIAQQRQVDVHSFQDVSLVDLDAFRTFSQRPEPYKIFTPFYRKWSDYMAQHGTGLHRTSLQDLQTAALAPELVRQFAPPGEYYPVTASLRLPVADDAPRKKLATFLETQVEHYKDVRDDFYYDSTSRLSLFLNSGAISARELYLTVQAEFPDRAERVTEPWLRQLAWRDFYYYQAVNNPDYFRYEKQYDFSPLSDMHYARWRDGETGIPIIDAAMRELNETGHMHNRLRMITAMFLTKNLLCPFTMGEQHFRRKLLDYDNVLNRGGWLWSSSLGYDGAPYFRIMNPVTQSNRFDAHGTYIRRQLPELAHLSAQEIHAPRTHAIVDLKSSRQIAIDVYKTILKPPPHPPV